VVIGGRPDRHDIAEYRTRNGWLSALLRGCPVTVPEPCLSVSPLVILARACPSVPRTAEPVATTPAGGLPSQLNIGGCDQSVAPGEADLAAREHCSTEADLAARELGGVETDPAAGELGAVEV
jgi:hypothetical protein